MFEKSFALSEDGMDFLRFIFKKHSVLSWAFDSWGSMKGIPPHLYSRLLH